MRLPDRVTGGAFAALGLWVAWHARGFPEGIGVAGPGLFPTIIGLAMAAAGLAIALGRHAPATGEAGGGTGARARRPRALAALAAVALGLAAYALLAPRLGAAPVGAALVAATALAWGRRWWEAAALGVASALLLHMAFAWLLRVPLPAGPVERWLG